MNDQLMGILQLLGQGTPVSGANPILSAYGLLSRYPFLRPMLHPSVLDKINGQIYPSLPSDPKLFTPTPGVRG